MSPSNDLQVALLREENKQLTEDIRAVLADFRKLEDEVISLRQIARYYQKKLYGKRQCRSLS
jgi:hypothetical protein